MSMRAILAIPAAAAAVLLAIIAAGLAVPASLLLMISGSGSQSTHCQAGPAAAAAAATTIASTSGEEVTLTAKQLRYVRQIVQIGTQEGVNGNGLVALVAAGLTESRLRMLANPNVPGSESYPNDGIGTDHQSVNIFQEQPWWGPSTADLMDPAFAIRAAIGGPNGPNHGSPAGLLDIPHWQDLAPAQLAQAFEVSARPDAYQAWVPAATQLVSAAGGATCLDTGSAGWKAPNGKTGADVVAYAMQFVGKVPYGNDCGAAGNPSGAWCCTGFVYWVYHQVLGIDLTSPVVSGQLAMAHQIPQSQAQAGDLVAWVGYHIGIYDGAGHVIAAADWGEGTKVDALPFDIGGVPPTYWRVNAIGNGAW